MSLKGCVLSFEVVFCVRRSLSFGCSGWLMIGIVSMTESVELKPIVPEFITSKITDRKLEIIIYNREKLLKLI